MAAILQEAQKFQSKRTTDFFIRTHNLRGTLLRCTTPIFFILISFDRLYSSSPKPKILSAINLFSSGNTYFPITFFTYIQKYENPHNYLENTIPYPNLH